MSDSLWPCGPQHARLPCPSPTPGVYSNSCALSRWCNSTISSSVIPFSSRLQSFLASGSFQMSQFFTSGGQGTGHQSTTNILDIGGGISPLYLFYLHYHYVQLSVRPSLFSLPPWQETQETRVRSLSRDCLKEGMTTHSSIIAGTIPWTWSLVGYGSWDHRELDMTGATKHVCMLYIVFRRI